MMMASTAVITGASSGIGKAVAVALRDRGYQVIGTSRKPDAAAPDSLVPGVDYRALDLTDPQSIDSFADGLGEVDVLVNNAGESQAGPLEELPADAIERLFRLNVLGPVQLTQRLLPGMRQRGSGRIVMVGSMLASFPLAYRSSYAASKAAIKGFATAARLEVAPFGVWITTVEPGSINTGITERRTRYVNENSDYADGFGKMMAKLDRNIDHGIAPDQVAQTIAKAIEAPRPKPLYAVGSSAPLVFTLRRLAPRTVVESVIARAYGLHRP
jgi:short-subunit dehydrogenase